MKISKKELNHWIQNKMSDFMSQEGLGQWRSDTQSGGWSKNTPSGLFSCGYGFLTYDIYKVQSSLNCRISYPSLEKLVRPIFENHQLIGKGAKARDLVSCVPIVEKPTSPSYIEVSQVTDLEAVVSAFKISFKQDVLPFFEQFYDLNQLYQVLKAETHRENLQNRLCSIHAEFKVLAIYRLCNDERYEALLEAEYVSIEKAYQQNPDHIELLKYWGAIQDLKKVLKQTKPIYNL